MTISEESEKAVQVAKEGDVPSISYEDIGGIKNEVSRLREMIELPLRHPELFKRLGVEAPKYCCMDLLVQGRRSWQRPWHVKLMPISIQLEDPK